MVPLDEPFINAYNLLTNLNVTLLDTMPQYVCQSCVQAVKFCVDFRERCITTETSLQEVLLEKIKTEENKPLADLKSSLDNPEVNIKQEPQEVKVEENDESIFDEYFDSVFVDFGDEEGFILKNEDTDDVKSKKRKYKKRNKLSLAERIEALTKLSCGLCKNTFKEKEDLSKHIEGHKTDRQCNICSELVSTWPGMVGHRITHIPQKEHRCHVCNKWAKTSVHMEHHYMNMHFDGEKTKLVCKQCDRPYDTPRQLSKHVNHAHSVKCFICDYCNKSFSNKQPLKTHIKSHSDSKCYVCDLCGFSCKHSGGLKDHKIRKHAPNKVTCKDCARVFATAADCDRHKCGHVTKICPVCGVQVAKRFNQHVQRHTAVSRYKCARCPAVYKSREALKVHLNRHDGVRSQQCEYCPLKFYTRSVLVKHLRVHTGEKPYVCKICQKGFTGKHNLKVHMKVHGEHLVVKRNKPEESPWHTIA